MAVEIKGGGASDLVSVDATSKAMRVTQYDTAGHVIDRSVPVPIAVNPVTVVDNDLLTSFDVSAYKFVSIQLTGTWVGEVRFQGSNDNGTFEDLVVQNTGSVTTPYVISVTGNGGVKIPVLFKWLRVRVTAYTSGTVTGTSFGLKEDANTGQISATGEVTLAAGQSLALDAGANTIGNVGLNAGATSIGSVGLNAGVNTIGSVSIAPGPLALITDFWVGLAGGAGANSRNIRNTGSTLRAIVMTNYAATARHVKIYNNSGTQTAGTGTPIIVLSLAAAGTLAYPIPSEGLVFSAGIAMTMTLGSANNDVTPTATAPDFSLTSIFT